MKPLTLLSLFLISYGLFIYGFQAIQRAHARAGGRLVAFDEDGERVFAPAMGTLSLGGGVFLLVLGSTRRK